MPLQEIQTQLEALYVPCCEEHNQPLPDLADSIESILDELIRTIYDLQGTDGSINEALARHVSETIWSGVVKGYGMDFNTVDYDSPDYNMLKALKDNVWQFGAAENYQHLRQLGDALLKEDGTLRTFAEFKEEAMKINNLFLNKYLKTEYNLAVAGGQMAGKWVTIMANKDTLPLLQFDAVLDAQTTDICRSLHGITVPIDHPIVARFYPPNHFNCRLTVRQLASGKITPDDKMALPEIPKMFQTNLGQQGLIFPADYPYFIGLPEVLRNRTAP